ncbi:MAG: diguanylate cyclase domain-containing protein [Lachnospiraceae bacterium]
MNKKRLKQYLDEIIEIRYYEPKKLLKLSRQLISEGKKDKDEIACAYGEYYQLEAYFRFGKLDEAMLKSSIRALQLTRKNNLYELECRCYNMLGIFLLNQGDVVAAMEYYQMGMNIALKHHYSGLIRILTNNLGDLYLQMKDYPKALYYLKKCYQQSVELMEKQKKNGKMLLHVSNLNVSILNISEVYYRLGDYAESLHYIKMLQPEEAEGRNSFYFGSVSAVYALNYGHMGRMEDAWGYIKQVVAAAEEGAGKLESVKDYLNVSSMLLDYGEVEYAGRLLTAVRKIAEELSLVNVWCDYYEVLIRYRKQCKDTELLLKTYEEYFEYKKQWERLVEQQRLQAIRNRQALDYAEKRQSRMEERNKQLKRMSEHDALTGLYNRYALNVECEKWYHEAKAKQTTLGMIVLDVDYFKQFNDTYGHLEGDNCLKCVSDVLREAVGSDGMIVRYGGDEFFVLLRGKTEEEVLELAENINICMRKRKYQHRASLVSDYVTLSQGIVNAVPEEIQTIPDFIHLADNALYKAKEARRGSIGVYGNDGNYNIYDNQRMMEEIKLQ